MPFDRPASHNMRAGIGVFLALGACAVALWLSLWWQSASYVEYVVTFTPEQGVYGIRESSQVRVGGIVHGAVLKVQPHLEGDQVTLYEVHFTLSESVPLYPRAFIQATAAGIGGDSTLDIMSTGRRGLSTDRTGGPMQRLAPGTRIVSSSPEQFDSMVGAESAARLRTLVSRIQDMRHAIGDISHDAPGRLEGVKTTWDQFTAMARKDVDDWRMRWNALSDHAERIVKNLGLKDDASSDAVVPAMRALREEASQIDLSEASKRLSMAQGALARSIDTLDALQAQAYAARTALNDAENGLASVAADFSIAGGELSATQAEVVPAIWRLFGTPSQQEVQRAMRVEEARIFAQAATEFEQATAFYKRVLDRDQEMLAKLPGMAEMLATQVRQSTAQFDSAVQRFSRVLLGQE